MHHAMPCRAADMHRHTSDHLRRLWTQMQACFCVVDVNLSFTSSSRCSSQCGIQETGVATNYQSACTSLMTILLDLLIAAAAAQTLYVKLHELDMTSCGTSFLTMLHA